jgi:uncharacterized protein YdaU (DUF1376 family)
VKPDSYMPLFGNDFFSAVNPHSPVIGMAYLRAIWHYWRETHCRGLPDDQEQLRRICAVDKDEWPSVCAVVFDNDKFFTQDSEGIWHQKRAEEEWKKAKSKYDAAVKGGQMTAKKRWEVERNK